jgi:hypothetical protein
MKKHIKIIFIVAIIGLLIVVAVGSAVLISRSSGRIVSSDITVEGIKSGTEKQDNYILAKVKDRYYEIAPSTDFMKTFLFDEWEITDGVPFDEEVVISLQFAELLVVDIYENGTIAAYDGYASRHYRSFAYYAIPETAVEEIGDFLEKNAKAREFGDGTISDSTFRHN